MSEMFHEQKLAVSGEDKREPFIPKLLDCFR
ncbi:hypothetical protein T11_18190 [Trichinella zimbabwensis]|uniref:Uncharacterized protein n=1 Tax=Trichinella zimbabwensis TaxID=268475 RepID=A0A0V1DK24_9BILA|nr:hypothetical protein T11_18190 [Trichinella zimbabwensis]